MDRRPNILLITVDSMRADHLGCYGYRWPTSPAMDTLAGQGVLAERLFCPVLPTQPSYTTLYTGQHPLTHGIVAHGGKAQLAPGTPVLPQLFLEAGYTTCALDNLMRQRPWFGRGYEYYIDPSVRRVLFLAVTAEELNRRAIQWLQTQDDSPFFMMLHYWDPHTPYVPPAHSRTLFYEGDNPTERSNRALAEWWQSPTGAMARDTWLRTPQGRITDPAYVTALYDQEIRYVDEAIGLLVATLDELGLAEQTLVIVLADHGESMTEHGIFFEHYGLYDTTLRVPFIARWPGVLPEGQRVRPMLTMTDVAPTLLDAAGLEIPEGMDGQSFWKLLTGEEESGGHEAIVSLESTWQTSRSLRTDTHKLIINGLPDGTSALTRELYDLVADPGEESNLVSENPALAAEMEAMLESWIATRLHTLGKEQNPLLQEGVSLRHELG
jgi:arylsulfatase